jgi:polyribonucleotide nucleotidyltransferase
VIDRSDPPAVPGGLAATSRRSSRSCCRPDANYDPDVLALCGASAALALSAFPLQKTIAGVRVGMVDGKYVINPTYEQRKKSSLDLVMAAATTRS